jgi:serine/threonine-protein kinase
VDVVLSVTAGPHAGKEFRFDRHDTFLVGRVPDAHLQLSYDDPYFSRRHFMIEVNPPRCRVLDLNSRNGIYVNGHRVQIAELREGDEVRAGHTVFRVRVVPDDPASRLTASVGGPTVSTAPADVSTVQHSPAEWAPPGYRVMERVGEGAMGVVYRAERESDGHPVAVKILRTASDVTPRQAARFLREAEILAKLEHPHIVRSLGTGAVGGLYIIMEWVEGPDLARVVKTRGPLPIRTAVRIVRQLLAGLGHAHAMGYVHRDVKPSNLLAGMSGDQRAVKVADFGLARAYDACQLSGLTFQGDVGGTPAFMAPEQVSHYRDVKPAADQYSAAATLYTLLTGTYVYDFRPDVGEQLIQIMTADPVPLGDRKSDLPAELTAAVMRGLARDPEKRFPDVLAMRDALRPFA